MNNTYNPTPKTSSRKRKGGRPSLPEDKRRTCCKKVYYTPEDCHCIEVAADENKMSVSEYIAQMSLTGKVVAPISEDFARDFRAVANLSNNLNQLAHCANAAGYQTVANEMTHEVPRIRGLLDVIFSSL